MTYHNPQVSNNHFESLDELSQKLLSQYQKGFPVQLNPFAVMAKKLQCTEPDVLSGLLMLRDQGIVTRIGPVFDHKKAGASLLAAVKVPESKKEDVASAINQYAEVNHNYGREHDYNLWFVVTAPSKAHLDNVLNEMEDSIGYDILRLPMVKSYHIDLGFSLHKKVAHLDLAPSEDLEPVLNGQPLLKSNQQQQLRVLIQDGIPLTRYPYQRLANLLNVKDASLVINTIQYWLDSGLIKRMGLVTNHHKLGFTSNAMVVWDIPKNKIDEIGEKFKQSGLVSLCYQRKRDLPNWGYNLYCMIHSCDREAVYKDIDTLKGIAGLPEIKSEVLFSNKQYKQKGGHYSVAKSNSLKKTLANFASSLVVPPVNPDNTVGAA
jgi:DNA-binding Lrp family transcriptional regulator